MVAAALPHSFCSMNSSLLTLYSRIDSFSVEFIAQSLPTLLLLLLCFLRSGLGKELENSCARHCGERERLFISHFYIFILSDVGMVARER
jgi:hypothetical protein